MFSFTPGRKLALFAAALFGLAAVPGVRAQTCDAVGRDILLDLLNQADLPAIAAQYGLNPTPIDQAGTRAGRPVRAV